MSNLQKKFDVHASVLPNSLSLSPTPSLTRALSKLGVDDEYVITRRPCDSKGSPQGLAAEVQPSVPLPPQAPSIWCESGMGLTEEQILQLYGADLTGGGKKKRSQFGSGLNPIPSAAATTATIISNIGQTPGQDNYYQRLGSQIRSHHLTFKIECFWRAYNGGSALSNDNLNCPPIRLLVYWDKMPALGATVWAENVVPPASYAALMNTVGLGEAYNSICSPSYNTHGTRYEFLVDEVITPVGEGFPSVVETGTGSATTFATVTARRNFHINLKNKLSTYYGTGGSTNLQNQLEYILIADLGSSTTPLPAAFVFWDLEFSDEIPIE